MRTAVVRTNSRKQATAAATGRDEFFFFSWALSSAPHTAPDDVFFFFFLVPPATRAISTVLAYFIWIEFKFQIISRQKIFKTDFSKIGSNDVIIFYFY